MNKFFSLSRRARVVEFSYNTTSSATVDGLRDALCQLKSCQLLLGKWEGTKGKKGGGKRTEEGKWILYIFYCLRFLVPRTAGLEIVSNKI